MSNDGLVVWCVKHLGRLLAVETLGRSGRNIWLPCCYSLQQTHRPRLGLWPNPRVGDSSHQALESRALAGRPIDRQKEDDLWMRSEFVRGPIGGRNTWTGVRSVRPLRTKSYHSWVGGRWARTIVAQTEAARDSGRQRAVRHRCQTFCMLQADVDWPAAPSDLRGLDRCAVPRWTPNGDVAVFRSGYKAIPGDAPPTQHHISRPTGPYREDETTRRRKRSEIRR